MISNPTVDGKMLSVKLIVKANTKNNKIRQKHKIHAPLNRKI